MERILISGATGFVGRALVENLARSKYELVLAVREARADAPKGDISETAIGDIGPDTDWSHALRGCSAVVHLAARTPAPGVTDETFASVNDQGTARLADQAADAGVRLFVNLSSLHALTSDGSLAEVNDRSDLDPTSAYGRSKRAAEAHVAKLAARGIVAVSLRPPVVIGAQAVGNWLLPQRLAASGLPLPFGGLARPRSLISIGNLVDAVAHVVATDRDTAPSGVFLVADAEPVSLRDIIRLLRQGMGLPPRLFGISPSMLALALAPFGTARTQGFLGGTAIDASGFREAYRWTPPFSAEEGIVLSGRVSVARSAAQK